MRFSRLLSLLFRISFHSLLAYETEKENANFAAWSRRKRHFTHRLNRATFWYLGRHQSNETGVDGEMRDQFILDVVTEILGAHYGSRRRLYRGLQKLGLAHEKLFVLVAWSSSLSSIIGGTVKGAAAVGRRFTWNSLPAGPVCVAVGFPVHSYALPPAGPIGADPKGIISSWGEYLQQGDVGAPRALLSLGEYTRRSRRLEGNGKVMGTPLTFYPRIVARKSRRWSIWAGDLVRLLNYAYQGDPREGSNGSVLLKLKRIVKYADSLQYRRLLADIATSGGVLEAIYILPFSGLGSLRYDRAVQERTVVFSYSDNMLVPPAPYFQVVKNGGGGFDSRPLIEELSLGVMRLTGSAAGFTDMFRLLDMARETINRTYGTRLPVHGCHPLVQRSAVMGYEEAETPGRIRELTLAVFDVPPEDAASQLGRALVGDWSCDLASVREFLEDIMVTAEARHFRILLKPKYSLANYSQEYRAIIEGAQRRLGIQLVVLSPYSRLGTMIEVADACLSFPYTSTKAIGHEAGRPSCYYVPESYRCEFESGARSADLIVGRTELNGWLARLSGEQLKPEAAQFTAEKACSHE